MVCSMLKKKKVGGGLCTVKTAPKCPFTHSPQQIRLLNIFSPSPSISKQGDTSLLFDFGLVHMTYFGTRDVSRRNATKFVN